MKIKFSYIIALSIMTIQIVHGVTRLGAQRSQAIVDFTKAQLYNHSSYPVVAYMYSNALSVNGSSYTVDENSLLNTNNIGILIPPGASTNWLSNTRSVEVYYGLKDSAVADIQSTNSYIIKASADKWTITKKLTTP